MVKKMPKVRGPSGLFLGRSREEKRRNKQGMLIPTFPSPLGIKGTQQTWNSFVGRREASRLEPQAGGDKGRGIQGRDPGHQARKTIIRAPTGYNVNEFIERYSDLEF